MRNAMISKRKISERRVLVTTFWVDLLDVVLVDLRTMQIGPDKLLVNIEVHMQDQLTTDDLEALIDKIKKRIHEKVSSIRYVLVELETQSNVYLIPRFSDVEVRESEM